MFGEQAAVVAVLRLLTRPVLLASLIPGLQHNHAPTSAPPQPRCHTPLRDALATLLPGGRALEPCL